MPRHATFAIAPEDKRNITVTLKLTERENSLLIDYAAHLESDRSYVAGKILEAFISAAKGPQDAAVKKPAKN
jgi:hypothetical protein